MIKKINSHYFIILLSVIALRFYSVLNINKLFIGGSTHDAGLYLYLIKNNIKNFFTLPFFDTQNFYPYSDSLAFSDNFLFPSFIVYLLEKTGLSFVVSYNITILLSLYLLGYFTYRLVKQLKLSNPLLISISTISLSYLFYNQGHPQLMFIFFIPLNFILFYRFLDNKKHSLLYTLINLLLCFLTTIYFFFYIILINIILCILNFKKLNFKNTLQQIPLATIPGILIIFFSYPYLQVARIFSTRGEHELEAFKATGLSLINASEHSIIYKLLSKISHNEAVLFPGLIILIAFTIYLLKEKICYNKLFSILKYLLILVILFSSNQLLLNIFTPLILIVSLVLNYKNKDNYKLQLLTVGIIFLLYSFNSPVTYFFYNFIPGFSSLRAISRFGFIFILLITILGLSSLKTKNLKILFLFSILIIFENYNLKYPHGYILKKPNILKEINTLKKDVLLYLPLTSKLNKNNSPTSWSDYALKNVNYMNYNLNTNAKSINGYSGIRTFTVNNYPRKFVNFPDQKSINTIKTISNLKYIILFGSDIPDFDKEGFIKRMQQFNNDLVIEKNINNDFLIKVKNTNFSQDLFYMTPNNLDAKLILNLNKKPSSFSYTINNTQYHIENKLLSKQIIINLKKNIDQKPYYKIYFKTNSNILNIKYEPIK